MIEIVSVSTPGEKGNPVSGQSGDMETHECFQCGKIFKSKSAVTGHVSKVHKVIEQLDGADRSMTEEVQPANICEFCGDMCTSTSSSHPYFQWYVQQHNIFCKKARQARGIED